MEKEMMSDKLKGMKNKAFTNYKYDSSEKGFCTRTINRMFRPSQIKRTGYKPECTREDGWELNKHFKFMKKKFPNSDGRLCRYCFKPWTYKVKKGKLGIGLQKRTKTYWTNFSIDRFNNNETYKKNNLVFCCSKCNSLKNGSTKYMWLRFLEVEKELGI